MIVTKDETIVVAVGEIISYNGSVYGCMVDPPTYGAGGCDNCAFKDVPICRIIECRPIMREDDLCVIFKLIGVMEGGEDERK